MYFKIYFVLEAVLEAFKKITNILVSVCHHSSSSDLERLFHCFKGRGLKKKTVSDVPFNSQLKNKIR